MAIDEALLESATRPLIRFYRWSRPAVSFGYFGKFADVKAFTTERDVVRRWTGGGIVLHGEDLTYSVVIPKAVSDVPASSPAIYAEIHQGLRKAIESKGIVAQLVTTKSERVSESCFANPVAADVITKNGKIAGAAHRRTRAGLLHQGSVQGIDTSHPLPAAFASCLSSNVRDADLGTDLLARASRIADSKYATLEWLHRR
jgi:lipoate-protein ligase A